MKGISFLAALASVVAVSACEVDFEPFEDTQAEISAFGFLQANADTQWVRVVPGRKHLQRPGNYEGHGLSMSIRGEREIAFRDTLLVTRDEEPALLFYTTEKIGPLTQWDLSIDGPGYEEVTARVEVPDLIPEGEVAYDVPYFIENEYRQSFFFTQLTDFFFIEACYWISLTESQKPQTACMRISQGRHLAVFPTGVLVTLFHSADRATILRNNGFIPAVAYYLHAAGLRVVFASEDWLPKDGVWNAETAILPGIFSNTSNGLGFVGGVSVNTIQWKPVKNDEPILSSLGFLYLPRE